MVWVILIFISLTFGLAVFVLLKQGRKKDFKLEELNYIRSHWIRIIDIVKMNPNQAVMDADKILDYALLRKGFEGNLGEKLKKAGAKFSDLNGVWSAHKLRNRLAHEMGEIGKEEARIALRNFKRALNDLGAKL